MFTNLKTSKKILPRHPMTFRFKLKPDNEVVRRGRAPNIALSIVYKIPYRRVQPLGRVRRASKGILHTQYNTIHYVHYSCTSL